MIESTKRPDQIVPLVIYKGGERLVIGQATVKGDGQIEGQISKDAKSDLKDLIFSGSLGDLSLNPNVEVAVVANLPSVPIVRTERESPRPSTSG